MKKHFLILSLIFNLQFALSQDMNFLIQQNGFRDIKLGSNINDYHDFVKKNKKNEEYFGLSGSRYEYIYAGKKYDDINDNQILRIFVNTIDDLIFEIEVITTKDNGLENFMELAYGKPTVSTASMKGWYPGTIRCRLTGDTDLFQNYFIEYEDVALVDLYFKRKVQADKEKAKKQF